MHSAPCLDRIGRSESTEPLAPGSFEAEPHMIEPRTDLLIVGGGPAGTQAATTAASKGGKVTLIE